MSRPRLPIGTFGTIGFQTASNGRVTARARYRDWDGKSRLVQAAGDTKRAAEQRLKAKLAERTLYQPAGIGLTADSPFPDLVRTGLKISILKTGSRPPHGSCMSATCAPW